MHELTEAIAECRLCSAAFRATKSGHRPRPVPWFAPGARLRIIGQAPGLRVHETGLPFNDRSGDRLRNWMGVDRDTFYDRDRIAITPMAFCFPGYDAKGSDLPPPRICAETWADRVDGVLAPELTLLIGGYAQKHHLGTRTSVTETVAGWRDHAPAILPLPHPSWRNTAWLRKNPWFEDDLVPFLRMRVAEVIG
ncbi:MAG TPA: uracil-DNA glycosylase [Maritimibacter sp.]|nr:uracil-DNA glycosylase [Maritimibacter sp.]